MYPPPNELYTVFSFIGFVSCVIPFYWNLHAWNTGTCVYLIWTGFGCLLQCINSIVWNKNTINRAPVYCDICKSPDALFRTPTHPPPGAISQQSVFKSHSMLRSRFVHFALIAAWPVAIGIVSGFYSVMAIYTLYKRERDLRRMVASARGLCGGRYIHLMVFSAMNIVGTIPLGTYIIMRDVEVGVRPWKSCADTHRHYSKVYQYPGFIWKNNLKFMGLEMFRWLVVACAFENFAFIGFAKEARQHYGLVYARLTGRIMRKAPPAPVPPHQPGMANLTMRAAPRVDEV